MATFKNYSIKAADGVFYESSKEKKEGFDVEYTRTDPETKTSTTYYHKHLTTLKGKLNKITVQETEYGTRLRMFIEENKDEISILDLPLLGQYGVGDYAKSLAPYIANLTRGMEIEMWLNRTSKNAKGRLYPNVFIKSGDEKIEWSFDPRVDAPKGFEEEVTNKITKKIEKKWNFEDHNAFYYEKIVKAVEAFSAASESTAPSTAPSTSATKAPASTPKPLKTPAPVAETTTQVEDTAEEEFDDLPF